MLSRKDEVFLLSQIHYERDKPEHYRARVFYPDGHRHTMAFKTKDMAIFICSGRFSSELLEVYEIVPGCPVEHKLADVVGGDWFITDKSKLKMKEVEGAIARWGRSIATDLIGDDDAPSEKQKRKAARKKRL